MKISLILITFCVMLLLVVPFFAQADTGIISIDIPNPLNYDTTDQIICALIKLLNTIAFGVALIMVIWGGIQIMTGMTTGEKESKVVKGKKTIMWAVIGYAIVFLVKFIIGFVIELLGGATTGICS